MNLRNQKKGKSCFTKNTSRILRHTGKGEQNMLKKRIPALVLLVCVLFAAAAQADKFGYEVDIPMLKSLEEQSSFPVQVTEKKVVLDTHDEKSFSDDGADSLVITVTNNTDKTLTGLEVGFIAVNENGCTTDVVSSFSIYSPGDSPEVKKAGRDDLSLAPGESIDLPMRVDYECFKGIRAMVIWYKTEDGKVNNPDYDLWQTYAFGLNSSNSTELD